MAVEIGALRALLSLDSAAFEKGAKRAQASMGKLERRLAQTGRRLKRFGREMSMRVTAPLAALSTAAVATSLKLVDSQAKFAQSLDTTVVSVQNLTRASELAGISQEDLNGSLRRMTRRISLAEQGTGAAVDAFKQLNLSASDLADLPVDERVNLINQRIREMIPAAEQAGVASKVFGDKSGLAMLRLDPSTLARASDEVLRFGAAMSEVAADDIEAANDALSMVGLAMRGLANQLTASLAPAVKTVADAIAGAVEWFSKLSPQMQSMIGIAAAVAAAIGPITFALGLMVTGLSAAIGGVAGLTAALFTLRGALISTGIGALIVGAGALADLIFRLKNQTGDWAEALGAVFRVGKETFFGVGRVAQGLFDILGGVASGITGSFVAAFAQIAKSWDALVNGMATAWNAIAETAFGEQLGLGSLGRSDVSGTLQGLADGLFGDAVEMINRGAERIKTSGDGVVDAISEIREILGKKTETTSEATEQAKKLQAVLDKIAGSGGGAAGGIKKAAEAVQKLEQGTSRAEGGFKRMFSSVISGASSAGDALDQMLNSLRNILAEDLTNSIFDKLGLSGPGGLIGNILGAIGIGGGTSPLRGQPVFDIASSFAGAFDSGGFIPPNKFGLVGERRPEFVSGPANVIGGAETARMMQGGSPVVNNISITAPPGSDIREERRPNSSGGEDLTILIDKAVSGLARDPGSQLSRTLGSNFGIKPTTRGR